jgi:hypothetical protein
MPRRTPSEVLKILAWPALALVVVMLILVTGGLGSAENVELGPIKIAFAKDLDRQVGAPSPEVAAAVRQLSPHQMEILVAHGQDTGRPVCVMGGLKENDSGPTPRAEREEVASYASLAAMGLIQFRGPGQSGSPWCRVDAVRYAWLTDSGTRTRRYLLDLLTKSIVIDKN